MGNDARAIPGAGTLSLCRRAGKLEMGFDAVTGSLRKGQAKLLIVAKDVSERTKRQVCFAARHGTVKLLPLPYTMDEMWYLTGKRIGVAAVTDQGLADKLSGEFAGSGMIEEEQII